MDNRALPRLIRGAIDAISLEAEIRQVPIVVVCHLCMGCGSGLNSFTGNSNLMKSGISAILRNFMSAIGAIFYYCLCLTASFYFSENFNFKFQIILVQIALTAFAPYKSDLIGRFLKPGCVQMIAPDIFDCIPGVWAC